MGSFVTLMQEKHKLELAKRDICNMSDVLDVVLLKLQAYQEGEDTETVEAMQFRFTDKADEMATVVVGADDEEDDDDEEAPKPKRKKSTAAAKKKRKRAE